jgi:Tol biopolymer transport system component
VWEIYSDPVFMPDGESIVFVAATAVAVRQEEAVEYNTEIFKCRLDGTGLQNLTKNPADDLNPAVTPDGRYLVFASDRDATNPRYRVKDIYRLDLQTNDLLNLTQSTANEREFKLSPDGTRIAFIRDSGSKVGDYSSWTYEYSLIVMDIDGGDPIELAGRTGSASWAADSKRLAFYARGTHIVDLSGNHDVYNWGGLNPIWGHDDECFYYSRSEDDRSGYWRINIDGTDDKQVVANIDHSRSGIALDTATGRVAIGASAGVRTLWSGIVVLDSLGNMMSDLRVEEGAFYVYDPCWSPDGQHLVFSRRMAGHYCPADKCGIFIMSPDGSNLRQIIAIREITDSTWTSETEP